MYDFRNGCIDSPFQAPSGKAARPELPFCSG